VCGHRNQRVKDMEWIREADHVHATLKVRMVSWGTYEAAKFEQRICYYNASI
jgi:hypothetical protein